MVLAAEWGTGQVLWSLIWLTIFFIWIWLVVRVFVDIFRSHDMSGWAKALWVVFIVVLPYLGVLVYFIARGEKMAQNERRAMQAQEAAMQSYIRDVAGTSASPADELERLAGLRERGVIDEAEFARLKARVVG